MGRLKFLFNEAAVQAGDALLIADLHLGIEHELEMKGIRVGSMFGKIEKRIFRLLKETKAKKLFLLGDVKHTIPNVEYYEYDALKNFLRRLGEEVDVIVAKGNHDGNLERYVEGIKMAPATGVRYGKIGMAHGHAWPAEELMACDWLVMGHAHPAVELIDEHGFKSTERVWAIGKARKEMRKRYGKMNKNLKIVLMPAFNELAGAFSLGKKELRGVIRHMFKLEDAQIFLLDGTPIGKMRRVR